MGAEEREGERKTGGEEWGGGVESGDPLFLVLHLRGS